MPTSNSLHVLLVEDSAVNQKLAELVLEKTGHTVVSAKTGREALTAMERETFDVILMDVQMPEMNGFEATYAIRQIERTTKEHTPIIAMTAHALKADRERCLKAGMDDYVVKPISADQLASAIDRVVGSSAGAEAISPNRAPLQEVLAADAMLARVDGDVELLRYIIQLFVEELPKLLSRIRSAIAECDCDELERAAHSLKGSVSNFHVGSVAAAAFRLETIGRQGNLIDAEESLSALEREIELFEAALISLGEEQPV